MPSTKRAMCGLLAGVAVLVADEASARERHRHAVPVATPPSDDALELGLLAPPSRLSTLTQSYGDASIARSHLQAVQRRAAEGAPAPYPCDPRQARASGYVCTNPPGVLGYGQYYAFTPSYVSSPQTVGVAPDPEPPILPPVTALFWAVNGARYDPH